jgi:valyl-tRNA synthetase
VSLCESNRNARKLNYCIHLLLTEEIWQFIAVRTKEEVIVSTWPEMKPFNAA